jgi:putative membrane protein
MRKLLGLLLAACVAVALSGCVVEKAQSTQNAPGAAQAASTSAASDSSQTVDASQSSSGTQAVAQDAASSSQGVIELTEKMYVTYINEIYTNYDDYIGRTINLQGMFGSEYYDANKTIYYYVYRVGPGCCGNDGSICGFEFTWDGGMPQDNDWIEVVGTLNKYDLDGQTYLTLKATSVTKMAVRGAENVYR